jgi:SAM-dependent methyltransferase
MQDSLLNNPDHYNELIARQVEQYKETEIMHDLPPIFHHMSRLTSFKAAEVTQKPDLISFYAEYFKQSLAESDSNYLVSIGAGDCSMEIKIVERLIAEKVTGFFFICLELSPVLIEKARRKIDSLQLGDVITVAQIDINKWHPRYLFAGVMAHHSLHHFLNLEQLFELIKRNLAPHGRFLTCDIIGRNGHMRWPEALLLTRKIWEKLPRKYKYNHQLQVFDDYFDNQDCSTEGFEGIRAQDILPLLVKMFSFEVFFGSGNLIDPFIDRSYGPNYDPENTNDTRFIEYVYELNEKLISEGIFKPTAIIAVMVNEEVSNPRYYKHWSPSFSIREPEKETPVYDPEPLLEGIPFQLNKDDDPLVVHQVGNYPLNTKLSFSRGGSGLKHFKYGWGIPEISFTWSTSESAALILPLGKVIHSDLFLNLEFIVYNSPLFPKPVINILVNGKEIDSSHTENLSGNEKVNWKLRIPAGLIVNKPILEIEFLFPTRRQPQYESGDDVRSLGIALISATVSTS